MPDDETDASRPVVADAGRAGRRAQKCQTCLVPMRFDGGRQIHDLWAELFVCATCGRETYRTFGRGSV